MTLRIAISSGFLTCRSSTSINDNYQTIVSSFISCCCGGAPLLHGADWNYFRGELEMGTMKRKRGKVHSSSYIYYVFLSDNHFHRLFLFPFLFFFGVFSFDLCYEIFLIPNFSIFFLFFFEIRFHSLLLSSHLNFCFCVLCWCKLLFPFLFVFFSMYEFLPVVSRFFACSKGE